MNLVIYQKDKTVKTILLALIVTVAICMLYSTMSTSRVVSVPTKSLYYNQTIVVDTIYSLH